MERKDLEFCLNCSIPDISKQEIWIWGAGNTSLLYQEGFKRIENDIKIQGYIDTDPKKIGNTFYGKRVIAPDGIKQTVMLVDEKDAVLAEEVARGRKEDASSSGKDVSEKEFLPGYATYEERLNQFRGQIDFLRWFMKDDKEGLELGLGQAFFKTSYLLEMARDYHYHPEQFEEYVDRFLWMCMEAIDEIPLDEDQKARLLQCAKHLGMDSLETHKNLTAGNTEKEIK